MEIVDQDGQSSYNTDEILSRWKTDYSDLLNSENGHNFDNVHYENVQQQLRGNNVPNNNNLNVDSLNQDITYQEVYEAVYRAKLRKAAGFDGIPSEVLRYDICIELLHKIISYCFKNGEVPTEWTKGIINPIPKSDTQDARNPLSYRGISLLSVPYKIYADILNQRLTKWLEENKLLVEEQNGFRKKRNCVEHIYTLYTIINSRKLSKQSTYVCFIDYKKAFDTVNRDLLWYKLMCIGITGRILDAIQSLYVNVQCTVKINDLFTPWFPVSTGLKQGCKISPTLFSVYINDLAQEINSLGCGVQLDDAMISTLLYADDIVLISPSAENLQTMLNAVDVWCRKWRLTVNPDKTNVIHFRTSSTARSNFVFKCGENNLDYTVLPATNT